MKRRLFLKKLGAVPVLGAAGPWAGQTQAQPGGALPELKTPHEPINTSSGDHGRSLFWALVNVAPIAAFASRRKAVVSPWSFIQQRLYPEKIGIHKELINGAQLGWSLLAHMADAAQITQRYTSSAAPTVETTVVWPDASLVLTAFGAEPEADGFYLRAELTNRDNREKEFRLEFTLDNVTAQIAEGLGLMDAQSHVLLQVVPVDEHPGAGSWQKFEVPKAGLKFLMTLKPSEKATVAVTMPEGSERSLPSFVAAQNSTETVWQSHLRGGMQVTLPDQRMQQAWDANLKQLGVFLEPRSDGLRILAGVGVYHGSCPYSTLQGCLALDQLGYHDLSEALLRRQLKRVRPDGVFEMWEREVVPPKVEQWIVQGLAPLAMWKHYEFVHDRNWLREIWPVIFRSVQATANARRGPQSSGKQGTVTIRGFVPPGWGDGGLPNGYSLPQNVGPLTGIWVALEIAKALDLPEQGWLQTEYEDYRKAILEVMRSSILEADGYKVLTSFPGSESDDAFNHMWGAVELVYPLAQFPVDDPMVIGSLRFLQSQKSHGLSLHLGFYKGVWPYMSAAIAHWEMRLGEYDEAYRTLQAILDYASPTWGWYEEIEHNPLQGYADMPQEWAACEMIETTRELLLLENGDEFLLGVGIPNSWTQPGQRVEVQGAAVTFGGRCSFSVEWFRNNARGHIRFLNASVPKTIRIRMLPADTRNPRVELRGAKLQSVAERFLSLVDCSNDIQIKASW